MSSQSELMHFAVILPSESKLKQEFFYYPATLHIDINKVKDIMNLKAPNRK